VWAAGALAGTDDATLERRAAFLLCDALLIAVCAEATFRCVERPLRDRGRRIAARVEARLAGRLAATPRAVASPSPR
jgi:peptidoglycan/LPS O-acetylase OafA/YrhL